MKKITKFCFTVQIQNPRCLKDLIFDKKNSHAILPVGTIYQIPSLDILSCGEVRSHWFDEENQTFYTQVRAQIVIQEDSVILLLEKMKDAGWEVFLNKTGIYLPV